MTALHPRRYPRRDQRHHLRRATGFTLIELLVALSVMALLALMSWRGMDGMARAQEQVRTRMDDVAALQTGLAQWTVDLESLMETPQVPGVDFDGRVLRLTRRDLSTPDAPLRVVGWAKRNVVGQHGGLGSWVRWQSPPLRSRAELQESWAEAQRWAQSSAAATTATASETAIVGLDQWQIFFFRNDAWSNPQSSAGTDAPAAGGSAPASTDAALPDGIRLVLTLSPGQALTGSLTKDWVRPVLGGGKS